MSILRDSQKQRLNSCYQIKRFSLSQAKTLSQFKAPQKLSGLKVQKKSIGKSFEAEGKIQSQLYSSLRPAQKVLDNRTKQSTFCSRERNSFHPRQSFKQKCTILKISQLSNLSAARVDSLIERQSEVNRQATDQQSRVSKSQFKFEFLIGKGGYGKVWKATQKKTGKPKAIKQLNKARIISTNSVQSVMKENQLLRKLKNPFIISIQRAFQSKECLYLVMEYLDGGDLRFHLKRRRRFREDQVRFFMANIILGLEHIHSHQILHRDLKPDNFVFDSEGYLRITDFGIAREAKQSNKDQTSGTPGYMSPEVLFHQNHTYTSDYYALGVIAYELMLGRRPYAGDQEQIRKQIIENPARVTLEQLPYKWSLIAVQFINKLLQAKPEERLGARGIQEIKNHPWMKDLKWQDIARKKFRAPFIPLSIQKHLEQYQKQISENTLSENSNKNFAQIKDEKIFQAYNYNPDSPCR